MTSIISIAFGRARSGLWRSRRIFIGVAIAGVAASALVGCSSDQPSYATPEVAVDTLVSAVRANKTDQLHKILGSEADKVLSSGDAVADANGRAEFLRQYDEKHSLVPAGEGAMTLNVGSTDWPMPIPVVQGDKGWYFDTGAGEDEMLNRRIGRNELFAINVCKAVADAQKEYAAADFNGDGWREYAVRFASEPGKKNGLYWPTKAPGEPESPLGELVAGAQAEGYAGTRPASDTTHPFHGYYFRILTAQGDAAPGGAMSFVAQGHMIGGFGIVAWPVEYANSGLKTFITSHHGVVYERDLGDETDRIARSMSTFNPEAGWNACDTSAP